MPAKGRNLALPKPALVNRESLLVLMKAGRSLRDSADSQSEQHPRASFSIAHEVAVQLSFPLGIRQRVVRQREVIHSDLDVTRAGKHLARQFIKRALFTGPGQVVIAVTALRRLYPGHQ